MLKIYIIIFEKYLYAVEMTLKKFSIGLFNFKLIEISKITNDKMDSK